MQKLYWPIIALGLSIGLLAVGTWQQNGDLLVSSILAQDELPGADDGRALARADELSNAFRTVANQALPAVVSIRTTGRVVKQRVQQRTSMRSSTAVF